MIASNSSPLIGSTAKFSFLTSARKSWSLIVSAICFAQYLDPVLGSARRQHIRSRNGADIVDSYLNQLASLVRFCHLDGQRDLHKLRLTLRHGLQHDVHIPTLDGFSPRRSNRFPAPTTTRELA